MKRYCLTHENIDVADWEEEGGNCFFVFSLPPELPENWIEFVSEPTPEELQLMDLNAQEILLDFALR